MLDTLHFAHAGEEKTGEVRLSDLTRLTDGLLSDEGMVSYRVRGSLEKGRPVLVLDVETTVMLLCQRCLEPCRQALQIERVFPIARDEAQLALWERDDPLLDALVAEPELDLLTLVEDEILLSLPVAPRHPEGECKKAD
jgi:uncharacterized protein